MFSLSLSWRKTNAGSATSSPLTGWSRSYPNSVNRVDFANSVIVGLGGQNGLTRGWMAGQLHLVRLHIVSMDQVFKALADASRRELLDRLRADNGQTLNELCTRLDMTRQAVSKHLGILEEANLVVTVKRGREKLHYLKPVPIHDIAERWIGKFERHRLQALSELKKELEARDE
jgi:DNA-binding transcriptional ArsR family regulator